MCNIIDEYWTKVYWSFQCLNTYLIITENLGDHEFILTIIKVASFHGHLC